MKNLSSELKKAPAVLILAAICLVIPFFVHNKYLLTVIEQIFMFAALGLAWNIIGGYAGQISWAHASFFCIGAYSMMMLFMKFQISPWVTLFVGMVLSAAFAFVMGKPSFRLRGTYFSLATIACGQMVRELIVYFAKYTGGNNGLFIPAGYSGWIALRFDSEVPYYYLFFVLMVLVVIVVKLVEGGRLGYYLKAMREDQDAAESLGIRTANVKLIALIISAMCVSVIGNFYAAKMAYVDPTMVGSFDLAVKIGVIAIVGGIGTVWGPIFGAVIIIPLMEACNAFLPATWGGASLALYGLILMLIVIFKPDGMWSVVLAAKDKIMAKKAEPQKAE